MVKIIHSQLPAFLAKRIEAAGPVRVGVIGAGKFRSMFLNQVPFSPHLNVVAIAAIARNLAMRLLPARRQLDRLAWIYEG